LKINRELDEGVAYQVPESCPAGLLKRFPRRFCQASRTIR